MAGFSSEAMVVADCRRARRRRQNLALSRARARGRPPVRDRLARRALLALTAGSGPLCSRPGLASRERKWTAPSGVTHEIFRSWPRRGRAPGGRGRGLHPTHPDSGEGDPDRAAGPRRARLRPDRHRQDGLVHPADDRNSGRGTGTIPSPPWPIRCSPRRRRASPWRASPWAAPWRRRSCAGRRRGYCGWRCSTARRASAPRSCTLFDG